jgi:hypothetical protein
MRYVFLLWGDEAADAAMTAEERREIVQEHIGFSQQLRDRGAFVAGEGLDVSTTAKLVRRGTPGGGVSDGPFLETKEQLGGFYLVECDDIDEAIELARELPPSPGLTVEIRPVP